MTDTVTSEAHEINRRRWNEVTPVHVGSEFYDVEGFVGGRGTLGEVERAAVGDLAGKRLLHLQCHFGMDTLSWVRLGAYGAVGIDFSDAAIATARHLAERTGLAERVTFVEADVTKAGRVESGNFDVVFTSLGTILWLEDLDGWAATIGANLARSGFFYFLDNHPLQMVFDETSTEARVKYDYFHNEAADVAPPGEGDYADPHYKVRTEGHEFCWAIQDIFGALERQGLTIFEVREYPFGFYAQFPDMEPAPDGYWYRKPGTEDLPLMLGFKARW